MSNIKSYFKNIVPILAAILSVTTAVVLLQKDAMIYLGLCTAGNTLCIILANIAVIASLTLVIAAIVLLVVASPDVLFSFFKNTRAKFKRHFQTPNFKNVKVSFIGNKTNEISIQVLNKEWRYPSVSIEALCGGNLKWKSPEKYDVVKVKRFQKIEASLIRAQKGKLYLESLRNPPEKLTTHEHKLDVILYITINKARISRPFFVDIKYEGKNQISITKITPLQDIPQEPSRFGMIEI